MRRLTIGLDGNNQLTNAQKLLRAFWFLFFSFTSVVYEIAVPGQQFYLSSVDKQVQQFTAKTVTFSQFRFDCFLNIFLFIIQFLGWGLIVLTGKDMLCYNSTSCHSAHIQSCMLRNFHVLYLCVPRGQSLLQRVCQELIDIL